MSLATSILQEFPKLNEDQHQAAEQTEGPLLIIAGPGSGKTLVLVVRTLNILLQGMAEPREIILCTFTEKVAFELRDRLSLAAKKLGYQGNLSELVIGTIHGICNDFLTRFRHKTPLGNNYEVLDELTQLLFLFDHFKEIIGEEKDGAYMGEWHTRWTAIEGARDYFNKITEELIDPDLLAKSTDPFVQAVGLAYQRYITKLFEMNRIDFANLQKLFFQLLKDPEAGSAILSHVRYVMVDEYQDTNFVQEQILLKLAGGDQNLCVVGDEDQALYRFRGATVRNILTFPKHFKDCRTITLSTNYRSHKKIIEAYNKFMASWDWIDRKTGTSYRFNKTILPDPEGSFPEYPAVFSIWGENLRDEAKRLADLISFLKENQVIEDESQVALLLHSVRFDYSEPYIKALTERGIRSFCPRARAYFENEEIQLMVGCFAVLLGYFGDGRGGNLSGSLQDLAAYTDACITELGRHFPRPHPLAELLSTFTEEIANLKEGDTLDHRLSDYLYQFLSKEPFADFLTNEIRARNLAIFSQLLSIFQSYYHYTVITTKNREFLRFHFFNSFMRLLHEGGINEYEDPDQPFPKGHVQIMTIHQSKGLEFPVVVVGSLAVQTSSPKKVDTVLSPYYHRPLFEPQHKITGFDRMRQHYVAFSRSEKILVLTSSNQPKSHFNPIWEGLEQWPYVKKDLLKSLSFNLKEKITLKKTYSFSSDLKVYEACPQRYQFFRYYEFTPSRSPEFFFGSLVHQTLEDIHRQVLDGKPLPMIGKKIPEVFDFNYRHLVNRGIRPIGVKQSKEALAQVMNYFHQNQKEMKRVIETEVDVSVEKDSYILIGKIDLLLGGDGKLELLDFKSESRPVEDDKRLNSYYKQLCIYAHILEQRYGKRPDRLLLYWTSEPKKADALMSFPYKPEVVEEAGRYFDAVVDKILQKDFTIRKVPEVKVCKECDFQIYCCGQGIIQLKE